MTIKVKSICLAIAFTMFAPIVAIADEVTEVIDDVAAKLVQQLPMDKKIALKSLSPDETGLPEDFLRKLTSDLEAALLTVSNFKISLQNRYTTEEIWSEAIEFGDANFDEIYKASKADFLILVSPRTIGNDVELNVQVMELIGPAAGRISVSTGYFNLGVNLDEMIGVNYDFLEERVQIEITKELNEIDRQIGLISYIRNNVSKDTAIDQRLVKLIQDKQAFVMDVNRTYKAKIDPRDNLDVSRSEAVFIPLKVPYFASQIGQTFFDTLPSSGSLVEGYLILSSGIDDDGAFELRFNFTEQPRGIGAKDTNLNLNLQEIRDLASALERMNVWEEKAREAKLNRGFAKTVLCFPQTDACQTSFDFVIFETKDGPEYGRLIVFNRGNATYSYSFEASIFNIVANYLKFLDKQGIHEFIKQVTDDGGLVSLFDQ